MNAFKFKIYIGVLALFSLPTFAQMPNGETEWYACTANSDCSIELGVCGKPGAINQKYLSDFKRWAQRQTAAMDCPLNRQKPFRNAICKNGKCSMELKVFDQWRQTHPEWSACNSTEDCSLEKSTCIGPQAISKLHIQAYREWCRQTLNLMDGCPAPNLTGREQFSVECEKKECILHEK